MVKDSELNSENEQQKPLRIVTWIYNCPCLVMLISLSLALIFAIITLLHPIEIDTRTDSFRVANHETTLSRALYREFQAETRGADISQFPRINNTNLPPAEDDDDNFRKRHEPSFNESKTHPRSARLGELFLVYETLPTNDELRNGDLLQPHLIKQIHDIEWGLRKLPRFNEFAHASLKKEIINRTGVVELPREQWRWQDPAPFFSILNLFYPTVNKSTALRQYNVYNVIDFDGLGTEQYPNSDIKNVLAFSLEDFGFFVSSQFSTWNRRSHVTRSVVSWGWTPPVGNVNEEEFIAAREEAEDKLGDWLWEVVWPYLEESSTDELRLLYWGDEGTSREIDNILFDDALWAVGSVVVVYVWMTMHFQAPILSALGMLGILVSIPAAYFVIRVVMDIETLGVLQGMSLFVILGIGVDDVFIFVDAWRQMGRIVGDNDIIRLDKAYRRAGGAMLVTSLTTAAAFGANGISKIPPIAHFGIFMACIVMVNYFLVITWFPACLIAHRRWLCCGNDLAKGRDKALLSNDAINNSNEIEKNNDNDDNNNVNVSCWRQPTRQIELFFEKIYAPWIFNKSKIILICFFVIFCVIIGISTQIKAASRSDRYFPDGHNIARVTDLDDGHFRDSDRESYPRVEIVFGAQSLDNSIDDGENGRGVVDPGDANEERLSSLNCLKHIENVCDSIKNLKISVNSENENYATPELAKFKYVARQDIYDIRCFAQKYFDYKESLPQNSTFDDELKNLKAFLAAPHRDPLNGRVFHNDVRFSRDEQKTLKGYIVAVNSTMSSLSSALLAQPHYQTWIRFAAEQNAKAPIGCQLSLNSYMFVDMTTQSVLIETAVLGSVLSCVLAFIILALFTRNIAVSAIAITGIIGVLLSLMSTMVLMGVEVSTIESVALTVIVGLSVDYCCHVVKVYANLCPVQWKDDQHKLRVLKTVFGEIGVSIFSGAITTLCSAFFLLFTTITFFSIFGIFVLLNILFSFVFCFLFVGAALATWAPTQAWSFASIWNRFLCGKKENLKNDANVVDQNKQEYQIESDETDEKIEENPKQSKEINENDVDLKPIQKKPKKKSRKKKSSQ